MNKKWPSRLVLFVGVLSALASCNREAQPSVSPVGSWRGTLTTISGGAGIQTFSAEITEVAQVESLYEGTFIIGDTLHNVSGSYLGNAQEGTHFSFNASPSELQAAVSDPFPYGFNWSGLMTETRYTGNWYVYEYPDGELSSEGTFSLERLP
jgi:hypothetical protein